MPSSSIIWIALVAVWLFVLVPMLVSRRPRIRQTTDAALATRVLFQGGAKRTARGPRPGTAATRTGDRHRISVTPTATTTMARTRRIE